MYTYDSIKSNCVNKNILYLVIKLELYLLYHNSIVLKFKCIKSEMKRKLLINIIYSLNNNSSLKIFKTLLFFYFRGITRNAIRRNKLCVKYEWIKE